MDSSPVLVLLNMAAAAALLIWAVRLVRTGFERAFGDQLRRWLRRSTANRLTSAATGAAAAILMQSSTAVAMLLAGFMSGTGTSNRQGLTLTAILGPESDGRLALPTQLAHLRAGPDGPRRSDGPANRGPYHSRTAGSGNNPAWT